MTKIQCENCGKVSKSIANYKAYGCNCRQSSKDVDALKPIMELLGVGFNFLKIFVIACIGFIIFLLGSFFSLIRILLSIPYKLIKKERIDIKLLPLEKNVIEYGLEIMPVGYKRKYIMLEEIN